MTISDCSIYQNVFVIIFLDIVFRELEDIFWTDFVSGILQTNALRRLTGCRVSLPGRVPIDRSGWKEGFPSCVGPSHHTRTSPAVRETLFTWHEVGMHLAVTRAVHGAAPGRRL